MNYRTLGRSGFTGKPLGLGTARLAGLGYQHEKKGLDFNSKPVREAIYQIQEAIELGITLFDTANNYGQGLSERILGEAIQGRRDDIVVVTKFG